MQVTDDLRDLLARLEVPPCECVPPPRPLCRCRLDQYPDLSPRTLDRLGGAGFRFGYHVEAFPDAPSLAKAAGLPQSLAAYVQRLVLSRRCLCPWWFPPPCPHTRDAWDFEAEGRLTFGEWAELLFASDPEAYAQPPPPGPLGVTVALDSAAEVYELRRGAGLGLWHPEDPWRDPDAQRYAVEASNHRNGETYARGICDD